MRRLPIALVVDVSSTPMLLQREVYNKWLLSLNTDVQYLIFVSSGNKNAQLGFDRYLFGQMRVYIKKSRKEYPWMPNFDTLLQISDKANNTLLNYLRSEIEEIVGSRDL